MSENINELRGFNIEVSEGMAAVPTRTNRETLEKAYENVRENVGCELQ